MGKPPERLDIHCATVGAYVVIALAVVCPPRPADAQTFEGARLVGFGRAQRALDDGNDAIYVNPAGLAFGKKYVVESGYIDDFRESDRRFNGSVVDSQAGPVAAGFAYTYANRRPVDLDGGDIRLEGHRFELALASLFTDSMSFGVNARYLTFDRTEDGDAIGGFSLFNVDVGAQYRLTPQLALGLVGYNLIKNDRPQTPIQLGGGLGYRGTLLLVEADVVYDFQAEDIEVSGAVGLTLLEMLELRGGVSWRELTDEVQVSAGLGLFVERVGIDLAWRQAVNPKGRGDDRDDRIFAVTLRARFK